MLKAVLEKGRKGFQQLVGSLRERQAQVEERRRVIRRECRLVVTCRTGEQRQASGVTDMGLGGMRLETRGRLAPGSFVTVFNPGSERGEVVCRVAWCRPERSHHVAGLQFADTDQRMARSWVRSALEKLGFTEWLYRERRKCPRLFAHAPLVVYTTAGEFLGDGVMVDFGARGCRLASEFGAAPGTRVVLAVEPVGKLPALRLTCVVRNWKKSPSRDRFCHGLELLDPDVDAVLRYLNLLCRIYYPN